MKFCCNVATILCSSLIYEYIILYIITFIEVNIVILFAEVKTEMIVLVT